jgi:phage-related protein
LKEQLQGVLQFLGSPAVQQAITTFAEMLATGIGMAVDWISGTAIPALQQFADWFMTVGWPAIQPFLEQVINALMPGLQQLGTWIMNLAVAVLPILSQAWEFLVANLDVVLPIVAAVGATILALSSPVTAIVGAVVLLATAWANNWGNIQGRTAAVIDFLRPYFEDLKALLGEFIRAILPPLREAWLALLSVWRTGIQPALADLWSALQELFAALGFGQGETDAWSVILGFLKLALEGVLLYVKLLTPAIRLAGAVITTMINNVRSGIDMLARFKRGIDGVIEAIRRMIDRVKDLAREMADMVVPDVLMPGSPSPLEVSFRGIAKAIEQIPQLQIGADLPAMAAAGAGGQPPQMTNVEINFAGGQGAPQDERQANDSAYMMVNALRARGVDL